MGSGESTHDRSSSNGAPEHIRGVAVRDPAERTPGESFARFVRRVGLERLSAAAHAAVHDGVR